MASQSIFWAIALICLSPGAICDQSAENSADSENSVDVVGDLSWDCANNASCVYKTASSVLSAYKIGKIVNFGLFSVEKLPPAQGQKAQSAGRSSKIFDFLNGNAIRVPIGPMVFSIQRAEDDDGYVELALLRKSSNEARRRGGGGGGGGGGPVKDHRDRKQMQMFIPMYLAATSFGWTMLAIKAVGILTLKALAVSKLAFLITALIIIKKLMETATEKMLYSHYPDHQQFLMPYNMEYGMAAHPMAQAAEMGGNEFFPMHMQPQHAEMEHIAAESALHHRTAEMTNGTQAQIVAAMAGVQKVKRDDGWQGAATHTQPKPVVYNYVPAKHPVYAYRKA